MNWCCHNCTERHIGCHGKCEKYIKQNEEHQKRRAKEKMDTEVVRYKNENIRKYLDGQAKHRKDHHGLHYKYSK